MLKVTIEEVLANGKIINVSHEGDFVSVYTIKNKDSESEVNSSMLGSTSVKYASEAAVANLFQVVEGEECEQKALERAIEQIKKRIDKLSPTRQRVCPGSGQDLKVTVLVGNDANEFLKGLLR